MVYTKEDTQSLLPRCVNGPVAQCTGNPVHFYLTKGAFLSKIKLRGCEALILGNSSFEWENMMSKSSLSSIDPGEVIGPDHSFNPPTFLSPIKPVVDEQVAPQEQRMRQIKTRSGQTYGAFDRAPQPKGSSIEPIETATGHDSTLPMKGPVESTEPGPKPFASPPSSHGNMISVERYEEELARLLEMPPGNAKKEQHDIVPLL